MPSSIRHVDRQGRVALPSDWRSKRLKRDQEVVITEHDDSLLIRPRRKVNLTDYFDTVEIDIDPKTFADYSLLRQALLKEKK